MDNEFLKDIGKNFKRLVYEKKILKKHIVIDLGISMNTLKRIESGFNVNVLTLHKIAKYMNIDINEFFKANLWIEKNL